MNNFETVTAKLKIILFQSKKSTVHDKDVALALGIMPSTFASMKRRNAMPYRQILDFCITHHINANTLLFQRPVNNIYKTSATIRYYQEVNAGAGSEGKVHIQMTLQDFLQLFLYKLASASS